MTRLICVLGSSPGIGKSTLCQGLRAHFDGLNVDHFAEKDIFTAPILVYLDGDPEKAQRRAVEREEPAWLDSFVAKLARHEVTPRVHDEEPRWRT